VSTIDVEEAPTPDIGDDPVYAGNQGNRVTWGNKLAPGPPPKMPSLGPCRDRVR
jgi:hypothetical protein